MIDVRQGDSRDVLKTLADASIDSCVTDPPYALVSIVKRFGKNGSAPAQDGASGVYKRASAGFMGQQWDTGETAFDPDFWAEVWRVLKPGAHLLAFGGTRSYHRLACAIEDAGFEIRDSIFYCYGSGFPKSHNVSKRLLDAKECCSCDKDMRGLRSSVDANDAVSGSAQQDLRESLRGLGDRPERAGQIVATQSASNGSVRRVRKGENDSAGVAAKGNDANMLAPLQWSSAGGGVEAARTQRRGGAQKEAGLADGEEPGMEGRRNAQEAAWELQGRALCEGAGVGQADGAQGRLHHGASSCNGSDVRVPVDANGSGQSHRSQSSEQSSEQFGTLPDERGSQAWGGWPVCRGCGKPIIAEGFGTALKPAVEPIVVARKPLIGTVAANVMAHGTGALNIDGCRIPTNGEVIEPVFAGRKGPDNGGKYGNSGDYLSNVSPLGRWPANLVHDGSPEVLACFPETGAAKSGGVAGWQDSYVGGKYTPIDRTGYDDSGGSAARFFYTVENEALCALCALPTDQKFDTDIGCNANNAEPLLATQNTETAVSVLCGVAERTPQESEGFRQQLTASADIVDGGSPPCRQRREDIAHENAPETPLSRIVRNVKCAASLCDSCATAIAQSLAATQRGHDPEYPLTLASMRERERQILSRHLALYAEGRESTGTITTIPSLKILLGSVLHAIADITKSEESAAAANISSDRKRLHYTSKADAGDRLGSKHPTVKPVDLMRWLVRLVTPPGGLVLDPFAGSGTTGMACMAEGFDALLIEREANFVEDIKRRIAHVSGQDAPLFAGQSEAVAPSQGTQDLRSLRGRKIGPVGLRK